MNIPTDFGERVRMQRQLRGLSQRELAAMTNEILSQPILAHLEKGLSGHKPANYVTRLPQEASAYHFAALKADRGRFSAFAPSGGGPQLASRPSD